ncbi:MAG: TVP38/TMEM64 family protein [Betaproteobacteria bacterium]|nr:TVP38/TMEM64 family protein [Betaproteobacteria bacterium]
MQRFGVALLLILPPTVFYLAGWREHFSVEALRQLIQDHRGAGLLGFVLAFVLGNLVQIPGWIFLAAAVLVLGKLWGGLAVYVAACTACMVSFLLFRGLGGPALRAWGNPVARRLLARLDAHPLSAVILLRLAFQTLPVLNVALALSGVRLRHYLLGTVLGLPLPIALYSLFFDGLARVLSWIGGGA